jgi:hypothetical protein
MSSGNVAPCAQFGVRGEGGGVMARVSEVPGSDAGADVLTSAPTLEAMLGRRSQARPEGGEIYTRRVVAFGSLPALDGETLEACVERYRSTSERRAPD